MKYILILIALSTNLIAQQFNITPLSINFNGVISIDDNIVIYGDNGYYYFSQDGANNWEQRLLLEQKNIRKIQENNGVLYGILEDGYLIKSTNKGLDWRITKFENDTSMKFVTMDVNDKNVYVRGIDEILKFDLDFNLVKRYKNSILNYYGPSLIFTYDVNLINKFIQYYNGYLVVPLQNENYLILNDELEYIKEVYLIDSLDAIDDPDARLIDMIVYGDELLVTLDGPIKSGLDYFIINETNLLGKWDEIVLSKDRKRLLFSSFKNELYTLEFSVETNEEDVGSTWRFKASVSKYRLRKYNKVTNDFDSIGEWFDSFFVLGLTRVTENGYSPIYTNKPNITSDSTVLVVGDKKTILTSQYGKNWNLFSYIEGTPSQIFNDNVYLNKGIYASTTKDGGLSSTNRRIVDTTDCHYCKFTNFHQSFISPNGNGFLYGSPIYDTWANIGFTKDSGNTFEFSYNTDFYFRTFKFATNFAELGDEYCTIHNRKTTASNPLLSSMWVTYAYYFNKDDFSDYRMEVLDTNEYRYYYLFTQSADYYQQVRYNFEQLHPKDQFLEIRTTTDAGKSWTSFHKIQNYSENFKFYEHNKDSLFITSYGYTSYGDFDYTNRVYLYDRTRDVVDTLFSEDEVNRKNLQLVFFDNHFYIMGDSILKVGNKTLTEWSDVQNWPTQNPSFEEVLSNGNVILTKYKDDTRKSKDFYLDNYYKIVADKTTDVEITTVALRTYEAYPNPTTGKVFAEIYWQSGFDIFESIKGVYDISGNLVSTREQIALTKSHNYSGLLEWDSSSHPSGIYFIVIKHGNNKQSIPFVVVE
ncbi:MAG: T9SS type A sorting domain-containing protein [Candidatus Kapaibacterium sp.]